MVILVGSIVIKHRNSLEAMVDSYRYSQDEIVEKLNKNNQQLQEYIDKNENITVRDLTEEEAKALNEGAITEEEAVDILTGNTPETQPPTDLPATQSNESEASEAPEAPEAPEEPKEPENSVDTIVSETIAKLYIQKNKYLGKLDAIEASVREEYNNMVISNKLDPKESKAAKQQFINSNIAKVAAWEKECDGIVYGILDEIKSALKESKQDDSIVKKLEQAYLNEKRLKKSYFINRYMD